MKICSKCLIEKPLSEYYVKDAKQNRLHSQCKLCYKEHRKTYHTQHYAKYGSDYKLRAKLYREKLRLEHRENMLAYLHDKACVECGESDIRVFELDHIDPRRKDFSISQAVRLGKKWHEVLLELEKCQVLCANCHKKRTAEQFGWYKTNGGAYRT